MRFRWTLGRVLCSDEYVRDASFVSKKILIEKCRIIILGAPHSAYRDVKIPEGKHLVDMWGFFQTDAQRS